MSNSKKTPTMESVMSTLPPNVDPFAYIEDVTLSQMDLNASGYLTGILTAFLVFHSMILIFCLFILIMSGISGRQQARWLVRSLKIKDRSGQIVYQSPLYFFNAGVLMAIVQLLCSACSWVYIWIQMKSSRSITNQSLHAKIVPPLAAMFIFESLSHWILTHCFFVAVYFSKRFNVEVKTGIRRWISPPIIINSFFAGFAVFLVLVVSGLASWTTFYHHKFAHKMMKIMGLLDQGSEDWKQLHDTVKLSDDQISKTSAHLGQTVLVLKQTASELGGHINDLSFALRWCVMMLCLTTSIICAVFVPVFWLLVQKYRQNIQQRSSRVFSLPHVDHTPNWLKRENVRNSVGMNILPVNSFPSSIRFLIMNKQFFFLLLRALGVFLSMASHWIILMVMVIKSREVVTSKHWRDFVTWVVISSGAWSAIPIVWQCWRLYTDQTKSGCPTNSTKDTSSFSKRDLRISQFHTEDIELEIKPPPAIIRQNAQKIPLGKL